ncbi:MAG TPA: hydrogenase 4 subunit B [Stellaceae bacterium]|nr:hydrogenase 4 subunit B [Stellaceae bacterium]
MLSAVAAGLGLFAAAALAGLAGRRLLTAVYLLAALAAAVIAIPALTMLIVGSPPAQSVLPLGLPWLGAHFRVDALSAFFLLVVDGAAILISLYALEYGAHDEEPGRVLPFYPIFLAAMNLVLVADDAFVFLVSWELMSLASWLLVLSTHRQPETRPAAFLYLVMASFGTGALLLAFGLLSGGVGSYAFDALRGTSLDPAKAAILFGLALIGTGSKAGLFPLHVWLPPAHSAAPSHVSALMSGIMTKVALYGFVRILFDLMGTPPWWWGVVVLIVGGITALMGVLYAVMQHDLKRLLAYHTVENIGIIVIGLGLALAFRANGLDAWAALALVAALLHVFNHAMFKSLLFLGSGAVLIATHERDMEHLGGLIHRMPRTAFVFLIGSVAISALPPFNGFVSEWLTFQAILGGSLLPQWLLKFAVPVVGAMLALSAALAAVCFVKAFGVVFLGRPRTAAAAEAREVGLRMVLPMAGFAAICTLVGIAPIVLVTLLRPVTALLISGSGTALPESSLLWLVPLGVERSSYSGLTILVAIALMAGALVLVIHRFASNRARRSAAWDCGFPDPRIETQYTAGSFAQPIRRIFGSTAFAARERVVMPEPGDGSPAEFEVTLRDPAWESIYGPVAALITWIADRMNVLQFQTIRRYLSLMFAALVLLLLIVAVSQ